MTQIVHAEGVIQLPQTGQTKCYDVSGAEVSCTGTRQDGEIQVGVAWPDPRFTSGTGTETDCITDNLTGLMWSKSGNLPNGTRTWNDAIDFANDLTLCGHSDWRLANINELESLVNAQLSNQSTWLSSQGFSDIGGSYWSSTTLDQSTNGAWAMTMWDGRVDYDSKTVLNGLHVLPVRDGQLGGQARVWKTGQTTTYRAGDDGDLQKGVSWPVPRFIDLGDGVVTDGLTGLVWTKDANAPGPAQCTPAASKTWQGALDYVKCLNTNQYLGHSDWRLPNRKELRSLEDYENNAPTLPTGHPFTNAGYWGGYWSSTTLISKPSQAWFPYIGNGSLEPNNKTNNYYVWPVRSGLTSSATISYTGKVQDASKNTITDAAITALTAAGNLSISAATYDASGNFNLTGLPSGTDFWLKINKSGYRNTYSAHHNSANNIDATTRPYTLYTDSEIDPWYTSAGVPRDTSKGVIVGRVFAQTSPSIGYVNGVALTATSANPARTYSVLYFNDSGPSSSISSTTTNGRFIVLNVDDGDTVTIAGIKSNWTDLQRIYKTFANSVSDGRINGSPSSTISYSSTVLDGSSNAPIQEVKVQLLGNSSIATLSDNSGNLTLPGLPPDTTLELMLTKSGYVTTYTSNMSFTGDHTSPRTYSLLTEQMLTNWGVTSGTGVIAGRVVDNANASTVSLSGAVVKYTSSMHPTSPPYIVKYRDASGHFVTGPSASTSSDGRYYIFNVEEGDTVKVTATKSGWDFTQKGPRTFVTHGNAVSQGLLYGVQTGYDPEETAIRNGFQAAIDAYNSKSETFLTTYVSLDYLDKGQNYDAFSENIRSEWSDANFQGRTYTVKSVTVTGPDTATIALTWMNGEADAIYLKKEGDTWKMYGNQEKYYVDFYGSHQDRNWDGSVNGKYYAGFNIDDPYNTVISAAVSGTGITSPRAFTKHGTNWWPDNPVDLGTTPPVNAAYTITVTDASGTHTYNGTVNGGVAAFATNLSPTGSITGTITFAFTGISGADRYGVDLFDASWNQKWHSSFENTTTTIAYTGPPLTSGTYYYQVQSKIGDNSSITWEQFTYTTGEPSPAVTLLSNDSALGIPRYLATDGTKLYIASVAGSNQKILSLPIGGGTVTDLYDAHNPMKLAILGDSIYWIDPNSGPITDTQIWKAPKAGGGNKTAIYAGSSAGEPIVDGSGIVAGGDGKLYTADEVNGRVQSLNPDGTGLAQLGNERYSGYFSNEHLNTITESSGILYIADQGKSGVIDPQVASIPASGGDFTTLHSGAPFNAINDIAVGDGSIYIADYGANTVWKMPLSGGTPAVLVSGSPFVKIHGLLYYNNTLYVADSEGKAIYKVALGQQTSSGTFSLSSGWNFVSFPKEPVKTTITEVLKEVSPNVRVVWGYDNASKSWLKYKPTSTNNTLAAIELGKGYWIYMNSSGSIDMTNWSALSKTITLYSGWNLVGYNGAGGTGALEKMPSGWIIIWGWENGTWKATKAPGVTTTVNVPELTTLEKGKAYWIKMSGDSTWTQ